MVAPRQRQPTAEPTSADVQIDSARPVQRDTVAGRSSSSPWPETQAEWNARNFPRLTRLWNGTLTEASGNRDHLAATRTHANPPADDTTTQATESEDLVTSPSNPTDGARRTSFQPDVDSAEPQQNTGRPDQPPLTGAATQPRQLTDIMPAPALEEPQQSVSTNRSNAAPAQAANPSDTASVTPRRHSTRASPRFRPLRRQRRAPRPPRRQPPQPATAPRPHLPSRPLRLRPISLRQ